LEFGNVGIKFGVIHLVQATDVERGRRLAPAAVEDDIGSRDAGRWAGVDVVDDGDQRTKGVVGVLAGKLANVPDDRGPAWAATMTWLEAARRCGVTLLPRQCIFLAFSTPYVSWLDHP